MSLCSHAEQRLAVCAVHKWLHWKTERNCPINGRSVSRIVFTHAACSLFGSSFCPFVSVALLQSNRP